MTPERLTPLDASFLALWPQHLAIGAVLLAPGSALTIERLRALVQPRLAWAPRSRQRIRWVPRNLARPVWEDDPGFALADHVREVTAPAPLDQAGLSAVVARLSNEPFDLAHAPWSIDLVAELDGGATGLILRAHHALADGEAMLGFFGALLLDLPTGTPEPVLEPWTPRPPRSSTALLADAVGDRARAMVARVRPWRPRRARPAADAAAVPALGDVAGLIARGWAARVPPAAFNVQADRRAGAGVTLWQAPLGALHEASHRVDAGVTVNDLVLAAVAGGLRAWLVAHGEPLRDLRALVPVDLDHEGADPTVGRTNRASRLFVTLPVGEPDPLRRARSVATQVAAGQARGDARVEARLSDLAYRLPGPLSRRAVGWLARGVWSFNVVVSDLAGPPLELSVAGRPVTALYPLSSLSSFDGLVLTYLSTAGDVSFSLVSHAAAIPDPQIIAAGIRADFATLGVRA